MDKCHFCQQEGGREPKMGLKAGVCFSCAIDRESAGVFDACLAGTFDFSSYTAAGGKQSTTVQTLILSKDRFTSVEEARGWAEANGFKVENVSDTDDAYTFRLKADDAFDPDGFGDGEAFRTIELTEGVRAVIGIPAVKAGHNTHKPHADGGCMTGFRRRGNMCVRVGSSADKAEDLDVEKRAGAPWSKIDNARRIVTGPVLIPRTADLEGDFEFERDIEDAAHGFMINMGKIGEMHEVIGGIGIPVESWITREPIKSGKGSKVLPAGTWLLSTKVINDETWEKVERGELNGYSIGYRGQRSEVS